MSINWAVIRPKLIEVFTRIAADQVTSLPEDPDAEPRYHDPFETPEWKAEWQERRNSAMHPIQGLELTLKITNVQTHGSDEIRRTMMVVPDSDPPVEDLYESVHGLRKMTLRVQAVTSEEEDAHWAFQTIERVRTRLSRSKTIADLLEVNVDITDVGTAIDSTFTHQKRRWSAATLDVFLTVGIEDVDMDDPAGWIERIIHTSHVQAQEGVDLPAPPNVIEDVLPPYEEEP